MAILFDEKHSAITIETANSTYQIGIGKYGFLLHLYYGKKVSGDMGYLINYRTRAYSLNPFDSGTDRTFALDNLPFEYPCYGSGDFRPAAFNMKTNAGVYGCDLRYVSHRVVPGKYAIPGLPAVYVDESKAVPLENKISMKNEPLESSAKTSVCKSETLEIVLADPVAGVEVTLLYGVIESLDVITRATIVRNTAASDIVITKALSGCLDFTHGDFDLLHFPGKQGMEHIQKRAPIIQGKQSFGSLRGASSHQHNPFVILADSSASEDTGSCYGMMLLYSGNFICEADRDQYCKTRISMGIQDEMFEYTLKPGEAFHTPEVAYAYSHSGLAHLSHTYHKLVSHHIVRGPYRDIMRPILVNSWEAAYFDFDGEKLIAIAQNAAKLGVEMLVLDDGWFGNRRADASGGLGDWYVNEEKLGMPLSAMVDEINGLGMKFGIWIEPEMVSTDSGLYHAHPDWAFAVPGRGPAWGRNQLVLDFSRKEVVDNIFNQIAAVMDSANIEYIKMDMNRSLADIYSHGETYQNAGATMHKFVLGVYDFLERMNTRYPHVLIEGCCGGGGRFDAGMLYYTPQIWCSDNTDAISRLKIHHGTSFGYPASAMGAHVTTVPNHQTGRSNICINTRGAVAMSGTFGYELDLGKLTADEQQAVKQQVADYKKYWHLIHQGQYYRLTDPNKNSAFAAWAYVSEDKSEALMNVVNLEAQCNPQTYYIALKGLDPDAMYNISVPGADDSNQDKMPTHETTQVSNIYSGSALMYGGLPVPTFRDEHQLWQVHIKTAGIAAQ